MQKPWQTIFYSEIKNWNAEKQKRTPYLIGHRTVNDPFLIPSSEALRFPIEVWFPITMNKAQSQSFDQMLGLIIQKAKVIYGHLLVVLYRTIQPPNTSGHTEIDDQKFQ